MIDMAKLFSSWLVLSLELFAQCLASGYATRGLICSTENTENGWSLRREYFPRGFPEPPFAMLK